MKRGAGHIRRVYDLHKTFGLYASGLLVMALSSGLYLVFPDYGKSLIGLFSATTLVPEDIASRPLPGEQPIGFDRAAARRQCLFRRWEVSVDLLSPRRERILSDREKGPR